MLQARLDGLLMGLGYRRHRLLAPGPIWYEPCRVPIVWDWVSDIERWWSDESALESGCRSSVG